MLSDLNALAAIGAAEHVGVAPDAACAALATFKNVRRRLELRGEAASPLLSYTGRRDVEATGTTLAAVMLDLNRQFPGLRFRMIDEQDQLRPHMRVFIGQEELRDIATPLDTAATLHIVQALSGG